MFKVYFDMDFRYVPRLENNEVYFISKIAFVAFN